MINQSRFSIVNADVIFTTAGGEAPKAIDIRQNIIQVSFFEHLNKPYIDASVALIDDFGLRSSLGTQGTERLQLVIAHAEQPTLPIIVKTFFFAAVKDVQKTNDRSEILLLDLVEEHVYVDAVKSISRSYETTLEDMCVGIAQTDLKKTMLKTKQFDGSAQGERKVVIPYMSPLQAIRWLNDRMTTKTGSPIYIHGDLYGNALYIRSLDRLMQAEVINKKLPLRYGDANACGGNESEAEKMYYEIKRFEEQEADNTLTLFEDGAIGSFYENIDASTGEAYGSHLSVRDILGDFYVNGLIKDKSLQSIFDPTLEIDGKFADEYNSLNIHQVTSRNTYNQFKSYHDETQLIEDNGNTLFESRLKAKNKVIRQILKKNRITIEMSGALFFEQQISPGRRMRILFLSPNVQGDTRDTTTTFDSRKSGDYLLMATAHTMLQESHKVTCQLVKLSDLPSDFEL